MQNIGSTGRGHLKRMALLAIVGVNLLGATLLGAPANTALGAPAATSPAKPVYAFYYLWWSQMHWHDKLGSAYPYSQSPLPLPATLGADGFNPVSRYAGNHLIDVPTSLASYDQDNPAVVEQDVRNAARAGISGFLANWVGTGDPNQTVTSISYSKRLQYLVDATNKVNSEGIPFKLWVDLKASDTILSDAHISGDLTYLVRQYAKCPAFDHSYSNRIMLIWQGSRKYGLSHIQTITKQFRNSFFVVGDETSKTWGDGRASYLDGDSYYWSSQDPYKNPQSFSQLQTLATAVRSGPANPDGSAKLWFAPFAPGYDSIVSAPGPPA